MGLYVKHLERVITFLMSAKKNKFDTWFMITFTQSWRLFCTRYFQWYSYYYYLKNLKQIVHYMYTVFIYLWSYTRIIWPIWTNLIRLCIYKFTYRLTKGVRFRVHVHGSRSRIKYKDITFSSAGRCTLQVIS